MTAEDDERSIDRSIDEAIEELRDDDTVGFVLVTTDGQAFTEVYHDPDQHEYRLGDPNAPTMSSRQLPLSYALASLTADAAEDLEQVAAALAVTAKNYFPPEGRVVEYQYERE